MSSPIKTVVVVASYGAVVRDVLRTELWKHLLSSGHRFIIFSPLADQPEFQKEFGRDRVIIKPLYSYHGSTVERILRELNKIGFYRINHSASINYVEMRTKQVYNWFWYYGRRFAWHLPFWSRGILRMLRKLVQHLTQVRTEYRTIFAQYQPDLVFSTMPFLLDEQPLLRLAEEQHIPIVCRIHSWDNITSKGAMMVHFERVMVWNDIMREEMLRYYPNEYKSDQIIAVGATQFDYYFTYKPITKADFFQQLQIPLDTRLILFSTAHHQRSPWEPTFVEQIYASLQKRQEPFLLYVRLHPREDMKYYEHLKQLPHVTIAYPGRKNMTVNDLWDPNWDDMKQFAHLLRYADLNINVASTVTIDAAIFDTPIINLAYDTSACAPERSIVPFYEFDHYEKIVATGGVTVVSNPTELDQAINAYLDNRAMNSVGRKRIVNEQIMYTDAQSSQRTANTILQFLQQ